MSIFKKKVEKKNTFRDALKWFNCLKVSQFGRPETPAKSSVVLLTLQKFLIYTFVCFF